MKKIVLLAAAVGALAIAGGAVAVAQSPTTVSDLAISADDKHGITVTVTGGPEGQRELTIPAGGVQRVPSTSGHRYTLTGSIDGKELEQVTVPGGSKQGWDCFASDDYGTPGFGCIVGTD